MVDSLRGAFPDLLLVDAGDVFGGISDPEKRKAEVLLRSMGVMGYDALCLGEIELNWGSDFLIDAAREAKVPLVCANLINNRTKKPLVDPYLIVKKGKLKVAVVGLLDDVLVLANASSGSDSLVIEDPMKVAHELIPGLKRKVDAVVVLSHLGYAKSSKLALEIPEVDAIVIGHNPSVSMEARQEGDALVMMTGTRGQYVGYLLMRFAGGERLETYESKLIPLDGRIKLHSLVQGFIEDYNKQERKVSEERGRREREDILSQSGQDRYLGEETCRRCHDSKYSVVAQMDHARAYESLAKSHSDGLPECLGCHTTGYGEPTGFVAATSLPDLRNVQCESCHGRGTGHKRDGSYAQVSERKCLVCHTKERSPEFSYSAYSRKIVH